MEIAYGGDFELLNKKTYREQKKISPTDVTAGYISLLILNVLDNCGQN